MMLFHLLNWLGMLLVPVVLGVLLVRRFRLPPFLFVAGMITFVLSQVVHIPLNAGVAELFADGVLPKPDPAVMRWALPVALGLSAGVCEEVARWIGMRFAVTSVRDWKTSVLYGAGHGGVEAMILGCLAAIGFFQLYAITDPYSLGLPADQADALAAAQTEFFGLPWYMRLMGLAERMFVLPCHIAMSVMVAQVWVRGSIAWLGIAIAFHTALDAVAVFLLFEGVDPMAIEGAIAAFGAASLGILWLLQDPPTPDEDVYEPVKPKTIERVSIERSAEVIE